MCLFIYLAQTIVSQMSIDLCCRDVRMSQKLLYRTQVGAIIKKVGSKGMPERMRRQVFSYPRPTAVILDYLPKSLAGHAVSVNCKKKRLFNFIAVMQKDWSSLEPLPKANTYFIFKLMSVTFRLINSETRMPVA